jgi:hypothetical protein
MAELARHTPEIVRNENGTIRNTSGITPNLVMEMLAHGGGVSERLAQPQRRERKRRRAADRELIVGRNDAAKAAPDVPHIEAVLRVDRRAAFPSRGRSSEGGDYLHHGSNICQALHIQTLAPWSENNVMRPNG